MVTRSFIAPPTSGGSYALRVSQAEATALATLSGASAGCACMAAGLAVPPRLAPLWSGCWPGVIDGNHVAGLLPEFVIAA
jgi:hypothetical protein